MSFGCTLGFCFLVSFVLGSLRLLPVQRMLGNSFFDPHLLLQ